MALFLISNHYYEIGRRVNKYEGNHLQTKEGKMKGKISIVLLVTVICVFTFVQISLADQAKEKSAVDASKAWLKLVDEGKYSESWNEAAQYFKNAANKEQWKSSLDAARTLLGKVLSRKLKSQQYTKTLSGAPDGEYVVIQYETSFENKQEAIETITPMLDKDGKWRVSGYYIRVKSQFSH